ncbi:hypothetical protein H8E88_34705 [candidate division KSB1 bacterium]|nr:hypothetical protein [candidate division KSB1 bacterium]MBL7093349.1 hypothetical protein [candidate division KSB1 bacterium]
MDFVFTENDIKKIAKILKCDWNLKGNNYRLNLQNSEKTRKLSLEIYPDMQIGEKFGNLISVYTENTHLQLHFCTGYVLSEMLEEVTFFSEQQGKVCGLIIEKEAGCNMYANVEKSILSGDFSTLGPEVMLGGIALSLTEHMIDSPSKKKHT